MEHKHGEYSGSVDENETTLREEGHETVELSASDIIPVESTDETSQADTTQVIERGDVDKQPDEGSPTEQLRTTVRADFHSPTNEHAVPAALLDKLTPTGEHRQTLEGSDPPKTVSRQADSSPGGHDSRAAKGAPRDGRTDPDLAALDERGRRQRSEVHRDGSVTFTAQSDAHGRVTLPHELLDGCNVVEGIIVRIRAKKVDR